MRVIGVQRPGTAPIFDLTIRHGQNPTMLIWRRGYVVRSWLTALTIDDEVVLTAHIAPRTHRHYPPKLKYADRRDVIRHPGETPLPHQRLAAYAVVVSRRGVLATECSARTIIPGLWQLPGGGVMPGETPAQAVVREVMEETGQTIDLQRLIDVQSDRWIGRTVDDVLEDFHAVRVIYTAFCPDPTTPTVLDIGGTTAQAKWVPLRRWRTLPWTSGARSALDKHLDKVKRPGKPRRSNGD